MIKERTPCSEEKHPEKKQRLRDIIYITTLITQLPFRYITIAMRCKSSCGQIVYWATDY